MSWDILPKNRIQYIFEKLKTVIPDAANNGILTIQKNGTNVATFSANQSEDVTANIDISEDIASTQTISGNPLTLTDAAPINAEKLEVVMEPKQDLHGQSYPYVGGAGKNKFDADTAYASYKQSDGSYRMTGTNVNGIYNYVPSNLVGKQITFSAYIDCSKETSPNYIRIYAIVNGQSVIGGDIGSGNKGYVSVTFTPQSTSDSFKFTYGTNGGGYFTMSELQLEEGSERTSYAPYSNICPISGYEGVEVDDVGVNQWDEEWEVGGINETNGSETSNSNYIRSGFIPLSGGMSIYGYSRVSSQLVAYFYTSDKGYIGFKVITNISYTVPSNTAFCRIRIEVDITNYTRGDISINYPSTDHNYHPYQSTTASITFGQTVYGGKSDFVEGGTKVTRYYKKNLKDLNWAADTSYSTHAFYAPSTDLPVPKNADTSAITSIISDRYKAETVYRIDRGYEGICEIKYNTGMRIWICDSRYDNVTDFKNSLEDCEICYEVATPTILTTPIAPLKLLDGINNISTNGTTINLGYQQNNVVGELKGEIEQAFYNHSMIYNLQSELTAVNMAYTDDFKAIGFDIPFIQEQRDYSTTPPTNWNIDLSACDIAVNGFLPLYEDAQTGILVESSKLIASIEQVQKKDDCFRVFVGFYNLKMTSAADNITNAFLILDITAFGKVLDLRTVYN